MGTLLKTGLQTMVFPALFHLYSVGPVGQPSIDRSQKLEQVVLGMRMNVLTLKVNLTNGVIPPYPRRILKGQGFEGGLSDLKDMIVFGIQ